MSILLDSCEAARFVDAEGEGSCLDGAADLEAWRRRSAYESCALPVELDHDDIIAGGSGG